MMAMFGWSDWVTGLTGWMLSVVDDRRMTIVVCIDNNQLRTGADSGNPTV